jgi:hypothetical protein
MELRSEAKLDVRSSQMFCYIDTLSENVFQVVLWYFVFHVVIFQQVCYKKIPLATGSFTMELCLWANLEVESSQMFCYIDTLSEIVFLMVLWYFVFHVVIFQQVCFRKIPLAMGSSTMDLCS